MDLVYPTVFELIVAVTATVATNLLALAYLRKVRQERPRRTIEDAIDELADHTRDDALLGARPL